MKVSVVFIGIPGIERREIEVEMGERAEVEVGRVVEEVCKIYPKIFLNPSFIFKRFVLLVEDRRGKTTNIRLKEGGGRLG
jgi:hypothetical protein